MSPTLLLLQTQIKWDALFNEDTVVPVVLFVIGGIVGLVAIVGHTWAQIVKTRATTQLKKAMIEQGMSAEEIERILSAGSSGEGKEKPPE